MPFLAHRTPAGESHLLIDHLNGVASMAARFAAAFDSAEWARFAGLWHDLGKYSDTFQAYIRTVTDPDAHESETVKKIDHSSAGAQHAVASSEILGHLIAYIIAGHHAGLLNGRDSGACLEKRLAKTVEAWRHGLSEQPEPNLPPLPAFIQQALSKPRESAFTIAFWLRMLFSALVDADFLDTESFMDEERKHQRPMWPDKILVQMEEALNQFIAQLPKTKTKVNDDRQSVREACLEAAERSPGRFTLTVPTGGGKTLASLAFALKHAQKQGMKRIIYVIPFTSIIEQNADVFRKVFKILGVEGVVLEHHSNFDPEKETTRTRLMTENWDAPLIVTTSVQFYESLFANKTSRCRKLHNLAHTVIILDEAQTLPVDYLKPCLSALKELSEHYHSSIVLCTATQPAVGRRDDFHIGLNIEPDREIIPNPEQLYQRLRRVCVNDIGAQSDEQLAERIDEHPQALCIVNTRKQAALIYKVLGAAPNHFHLSALMCPIHRSQMLGEIRNRLHTEQPCRVVSTQLIEAGVDVDFPVVFRSTSGMDSIAQAAGRCNREGRMDKGQVFVFKSEHRASERFFSETAGCAEQVFELYDDPLSLEAIEHYFRLYYWSQNDRWDKKQIMQKYQLLQDRSLPFSFSFADTARDFKLIEEHSKPVIIPWQEEGQKLCAQLRAMPQPSRKVLRKLQRYTVQIPERTWNRHLHKSFDWVHGQYAVLISPALHYSDEIGLALEGDHVNSDFWIM